MKKQSKIWGLIDDFMEAVDSKSPALLTGLAIAGLVSAVAYTYKAAPEIQHKIKEAKMKLEKLPKKGEERSAVIKKAVKEIAPDVTVIGLLTTASAACVIGSNRVSTKRIAVLSAAYQLAESSLGDYKKKAEELIDKKHLPLVGEAVAKDKAKKVNLEKDQNGTIVIPGDGDCWCMDGYIGGVPFRSSAEKIRTAIAELSYDCMSTMYVSVADLWDKVGIPKCPPVGDTIGWTVDDLDGGKLPINLTACLSEDGKPLLVMDYDVQLLDTRRM